MNDLKIYIQQAIEQPLSYDDARAAFNIIMQGKASNAQIGGFLIALRARGETLNEYTAAAQIMRQKCTAVVAPDAAMDIVGTGGDGKSTLNISTATALVTAGAGVIVAKHGNRNLTSKSGTADVFSASGVNVMVGAQVVERALRQIGLAFMMAPMFHKAMKHVMSARGALGVRTIFNFLGPLTNPAGVKRQLTGVFLPDMIIPMAKVLLRLGSKRAWLVHGDDGTDEISIAATTSVAVLQNNKITTMEIHPEDAGLPVHPFKAIVGGSPQHNAAALQALLAGKKSAYRDAVLLNTAAALVIAEKACDLKSGVEIAKHSIDSQAAKKKLIGLRKITTKSYKSDG